MSNTSSVTPYVIAPVAAGVAVVTGVAVLAKWLMEESDEERACRKEQRRAYYEETLSRASVVDRREERSRNTHAPRLTSVPLHVRDVGSILGSATKLGYRVERQRETGAAASRQAQFLLRRGSERLAVTLDQGCVALHTAGSRRLVHAVVRQHTLDRAVEHLRGRDMDVQVRQRANGEIELAAKERSNRHRDGRAEVRAQVREDGAVRLDVDGIVGSRCKEVRDGFAEAIGGVAGETAYKTAFYTLPGEPTKIDDRVRGW